MWGSRYRKCLFNFCRYFCKHFCQEWFSVSEYDGNEAETKRRRKRLYTAFEF